MEWLDFTALAQPASGGGAMSCCFKLFSNSVAHAALPQRIIAKAFGAIARLIRYEGDPS